MNALKELQDAVSAIFTTTVKAAAADEEESEEASEAEEEEEDEDEEDLVDPLDTVKEKYSNSSTCAQLKNILAECEDRVRSKERTRETCYEELIDFLECVDHCVVEEGVPTK